MSPIEFRKALRRAVRLHIKEIRDGCVDCIETFDKGKGLSCSKHKKIINRILDHPKENLPPELLPKQ